MFGSFFEPKILIDVPREKFSPIPKTDSVLIDLIKLPDPIESKNLGRFLRQYMYQHEDQLVRNSLMEGLIKYHRLIFEKPLTKNETRLIVSEKKIEQKLLDKHPNNAEIYEIVGEKFNFLKLQIH